MLGLEPDTEQTQQDTDQIQQDPNKPCVIISWSEGQSSAEHVWVAVQCLVVQRTCLGLLGRNLAQAAADSSWRSHTDKKGTAGACETARLGWQLTQGCNANTPGTKPRFKHLRQSSHDREARDGSLTCVTGHPLAAEGKASYTRRVDNGGRERSLVRGEPTKTSLKEEKLPLSPGLCMFCAHCVLSFDATRQVGWDRWAGTRGAFTRPRWVQVS